MSARVSRGCLRCRTRRVKCDQGRPSCERCIKRNELCTGYRDDATLLFKSENENITRRINRRASFDSSSQSSRTSQSSKGSQKLNSLEVPGLSGADISALNHSNPFPWAKSVPIASLPSAEDLAVDQFFEKYVIYPCNQGSSPGFLEFLPSLFKDCQIEGRLALRWAVRAAAYAGLITYQRNSEVESKALKCYGLSLSALGEALGDPKQAPDDYTLMTIVVLDLFETIYLPDPMSKGNHAIGMAQLLRLRGPDQIYAARGWSLFRLSHHRLQKQQLAFRQAPLPESQAWLDSLNEELPHVRTEKNNHEISKICSRARTLLACINEGGNEETIEMIREMNTLDQVSASWRTGPGWVFKTISRSEISADPVALVQFPEYVQLHQDVWIAYEWNYHRTARIILHEHLLQCLAHLEGVDGYNLVHISSFREHSVSTIQFLVAEILSTVPQSLGDIDHEGNLLENAQRLSLCEGIGGYFLLWPIKILKSLPFATESQRNNAKEVFERIRESTGMKTLLGDASSI